MRLISTFQQLLLIACMFSAHMADAQFQGKVYEAYNDAVVMDGTMSIHSPWCGGINSVQINLADLNNDGKKDLVLYDNNSYVIKTFVNVGNTNDIKYAYDPKYESNFPTIMNYMILKDYNCDGVSDLFHKGISGVSVFKGYYSAGQLKFTYYKDLYFPGAFGPVNVFVQPDDIPAIIDEDGDGDLDVLAYGVNGNLMEFTKNMQVELGLPCDTMRMELVTNCYGKFFQGVYRTANLGYSCKGVATESNHKKLRHTGNCIAVFDADGDQDLDILGGNLAYNDIQMLYNGGGSGVSTITQQDTLYNSLEHGLYMPSWPAPFHVDIDNDGDKDILITSHNENSSSANYNAVAFYKNNGTDLSPNFEYQHDSLLTPDMIDVGSFSYPVFFDYDKDNKPDLFIGTEGYLDNVSGTRHSMIAYYRNTSTVGATSFELITKDFLGLSIHSYNGIFPTFGDITGDGIQDLVMGNVGGSIAVYKNYASSNTVTPNFLLQTDSLAGVSVGAYSAPAVFDFNQDGRTDLLVGNRTGYITYFEDTSSTSLKKFSLQTISLGNLKAGDVSNLYGYCVPVICKMDNTNKDFLIIGNIDGTVARYDSFINNMATFVRIDSNYSYIKTIARSVPAIADLDGDGKYEMVVGNKLGGLSYFKQIKNVLESIDEEVLSATAVDLYPNPSTDMLHVLFKTDLSKQSLRISLFDLSGKEVMRKEFVHPSTADMNISSLRPGMYLAEISCGNHKVTKKVIKAGR